MKTVYLGGPITGLDYQGCTDWREYAKIELFKSKILGVSPMRAKEYLSLEKKISDFYDNALSCSKGITTRDRFDVASSDIILFNFLGAKKVSIGSIIEYGWADSAGKPIITIMEKKGNLHDHGMVRELTGFRVEELDQGLTIAKAILTY